ncbi:MAG: anti-sigma factor antagonist [Clostridia bacterium]|nr:anti-sigma factor antagonist [Clostridia bacterium]
MTFEKNSDALTISLTGRIDSSNAPDVEKEIATIGFTPQDSLILDFSDLEYISSAGLRVILRLKKSNKDTKIINVSGDVYDIFEMTGFTEMMDISKAYREMSVEGCEVIGEGANGLVYRIDADTIIKVYKNPDSLDEIHNERELARKAFVMGIPTAIPYDVVKVGNLYGSVFELLNAKSFANLICEDPSCIETLAAESVEILKAMHATVMEPGELPNKKLTAINWVQKCEPYLKAEVYNRLHELVCNIPDSNIMLHGDFHIKNIMKQNGENLLIDMDTLSQGHPIFEFAAIFLAYVGFSCVDRENVKGFLGISYEEASLFWNTTLKCYFDDKDEAYIEQIKRKASIIGYTRLLHRSAEKVGLDTDMGKQLVAYCKQYIEENIDKVDTLYF